MKDVQIKVRAESGPSWAPSASLRLISVGYLNRKVQFPPSKSSQIPSTAYQKAMLATESTEWLFCFPHPEERSGRLWMAWTTVVWSHDAPASQQLHPRTQKQHRPLLPNTSLLLGPLPRSALLSVPRAGPVAQQVPPAEELPFSRRHTDIAANGLSHAAVLPASALRTLHRSVCFSHVTFGHYFPPSHCTVASSHVQAETLIPWPLRWQQHQTEVFSPTRAWWGAHPLHNKQTRENLCCRLL